eukprot:8340443-Prorocentrum_lima.AAC.1
MAHNGENADQHETHEMHEIGLSFFCEIHVFFPDQQFLSFGQDSSIFCENAGISGARNQAAQ